MGLVDTLTAQVRREGIGFRVHFGTELGASPLAVGVSFARLTLLRDRLRDMGAAPKTRPFPSGPHDNGDVTLELWLEDMLERWWQLSDAAKVAVSESFSFGESEQGEGGRGGGMTANPRLRMFSIGDSQHARGGVDAATDGQLRAPLMSPFS